MYYSTGRSPHLPKVGVAVEVECTITAEVLIKKGFIVESEDDLATYKKENKVNKKNYVDNSGKTYTEEEFLKMDKRTNIYKEIQANLK